MATVSDGLTHAYRTAVQLAEITLDTEVDIPRRPLAILSRCGQKIIMRSEPLQPEC